VNVKALAPRGGGGTQVEKEFLDFLPVPENFVAYVKSFSKMCTNLLSIRIILNLVWDKIHYVFKNTETGKI
jgi:hypothetical protein